MARFKVSLSLSGGQSGAKIIIGCADDPVERMKHIEAQQLAKVDPRLKGGYDERVNPSDAEQIILQTLANALVVADAAQSFGDVWRGGERNYQSRKRMILKLLPSIIGA
ncbi:hypothetical protein D5085_13645 [Ectothiorhodospiraceae bacterium BW-2]|nr:hypothetical protein D5085_13645 [Ectothiorhodospiraceae bacterium BW-2]